MRTKGRLQRLRKVLSDKMDYIELADGSRYWFEPSEAAVTLFRYFTDSMRSIYHGTERPPPPDLIHAVAGARDRRLALSKLSTKGVEPSLPICIEDLVEHGKITPRELIAKRRSGTVEEPEPHAE